MARYFTGCETIEDIKRTFKELAKKLHPDNGGDAEEFKEMMSQYTEAFNNLKNIHSSVNGGTYEKATAETAEQFADIINKVIFMDGVNVEIIGSWVWLSGNTYIYKDQIKVAGFFYSKSKKSWYYNGEEKKSHRRGHYSMKQLRSKWGSVEVETEPTKALA